MAKKRMKAPGAEQKVGRNHPPMHTRFRKGESGNKNGRPKGSKNFATYLMEAAHDQVVITLGGKKRRISKLHATAMKLADKAVGGNQAAINKFFDWIDEFETRAAAARPTEFPLSAADIEVLRAAYERMKQCDTEKPGE